MKPIATIIRETMPEGVWVRGQSITYKDTSYTKTAATTRWASKRLAAGAWDKAAQKKFQTRVKRILGKGYTVWVYGNEVLVYTEEKIKIVKA